MSTIFAVLKKTSDESPSYVDNILTTKCSWEDLDGHFEPIAVRHNWGKFSWISSIGDLLPPNTPVWALDNSPQGIYTLKDIIREMMNYDSIQWHSYNRANADSYPPEGEEVLVTNGTNCDVACYLMSGEYIWKKVHIENDTYEDFTSFVPTKWAYIENLQNSQNKEAIELLSNILPLIEVIEPTLHPSIVGTAQWIKKTKQLLNEKTKTN